MCFLRFFSCFFCFKVFQGFSGFLVGFRIILRVLCCFRWVEGFWMGFGWVLRFF